MKRCKYCLALLFGIVISGLPLFAQNAGGTSAATGKTTSSSSASTTKSKSSSAASKLDINSATADQLKALPGIGDATAQKIIASRPYHAKNDLVSRNIISQSEYGAIKDQIIAHRTQGASSSTAKNAPAKQ